MGVSHDVPEGDVVMQDAPNGNNHGTCFGLSFVDTCFIMTMLHNMQLRQDKRYVEDCQRRNVFKAEQMKQFLLMQEHMTLQDTNFEAFASYVTESLVSLRNEMHTNHATTISRINHMIVTQNENHRHYAQFYRKMCDFLDYHYGNYGQGWHRGYRLMPRGRGGR